MMKARALILLLILNLVGAPIIMASSDKKAGTSGAVFLRMGAGARPTAMGDAFVGVADDVNAVYFNPAGLGLLERPELTAMHTQWIQGLNYNFGAYALPTSKGTFALSAATLSTDDINRTGTDEGNLGTFQNQDSAYALSYGLDLSDTFAVGTTARWVRQKIDTASAQTWAADVGILKRFEESPISLGLAVRHVGPEIKFNDEGDPLPMTIDGGAGYRFASDRLLMAFNVRQIRDAGVKFGVGSEWKDLIAEKFRYALRAGFNNSAVDTNGASGMSLGGGVGFKQFDLDFAWVPFGDLGNTFRYAAVIKF